MKGMDKMDRTEAYQFFMEQLQESALEKYSTTQEADLRRARQEELEQVMENELTADQQPILEKILAEIISFHDQEADLLYRQGMRDCVWLLKSLGVLA